MKLFKKGKKNVFPISALNGVGIKPLLAEVFRKIKTTRSDAFFIVPVNVGELFYADVVNIPGFEYIKGTDYA